MRTANFPGLLIITTLAAGLFLPTAHADEKDDIIRELKLKVELQKKELESADQVRKDLRLILDEQQKERARHLKEIEQLRKDVKIPELVKLLDDLKQVRNELQNAKEIAKTRQEQNEKLLDQVRELTRKIAQLEAGGKPDALPVRDPNAPNPPPGKLDGKVEKVEGTLVQINLGTDHGLQQDHTLMVFRTQPAPKFLGMVRIVDARAKNSVGRVVGKVELKEGDLVTSDLQRDSPKKADPPPKGNAPPAAIRGSIEKIDAKDATLVTLSIGSDVGLKKDQTLEVYRLKPEPQYLGTVRIVEVTPHKAIARRVGNKGNALQVGDEVATSLSAADR